MLAFSKQEFDIHQPFTIIELHKQTRQTFNTFDVQQAHQIYKNIEECDIAESPYWDNAKHQFGYRDESFIVVQCDHCQKWRKCDRAKIQKYMTKTWYCWYTPDIRGYQNCDVDEQEFDEKLWRTWIQPKGKWIFVFNGKLVGDDNYKYMIKQRNRNVGTSTHCLISVVARLVVKSP
ncbi:MAG: hypothetical protein GWO82_06640 [Bacteroidetes bacterium]|nr:hypothetical protein [Bacteroidota bacterium]